MKNILLLLIAFLLLFTACNIESGSNKEGKSTKKEKTKDGIRKAYHDNGKLKSEVTYVNGKKNGLARDFYNTGQVRVEISYKDGIKDGDSKMYYENGKLFRLTPYKDGLIDGIQKRYRENGDLMCEAPFKLNKPGTGLKEYTLKNKLKTDYPEIRVKEINKMVLNNEFMLQLTLSEKARKVKFYLGELQDGQYLHDGLFHIQTSSDGVGEHKFLLPRGAFLMEKLNIVASFETNQDNVCVIQKAYNLSIENR